MDAKHLQQSDPDIFNLIEQEEVRQHTKLRLIASENYASHAVMQATGSVLTNKYSEGYAAKRYYEGQEFIDQIELLAINRAKDLFGAEHVNVQPYSGSPANMAVYYAFMKPGDRVLGFGLPFGGHLTHGWKVNFSGITYDAKQYGSRKEDGLIDFDEVRKLAKEHQPKVIFCGGTAYPRIIEFDKFREIADEVGAILAADIAHISGLVAGGAHPSPVGIADVVTSTTHKTLRGPRGGMIMCKAEHAAAVDRAVFPCLQGGPHNHTTAALAVALREANTPEFKDYAHQIVKNSRALAEKLLADGFELVSGGSDNHTVLVDVTPRGSTGKIMAKSLNEAGIVVNMNSIPFDSRKPFDPSGIRIGTASLTSRNMKEPEMQKVGEWISQVAKDPENTNLLSKVATEIKDFCQQFPAPGITIK